jgi:hypothetical protein
MSRRFLLVLTTLLAFAGVSTASAVAASGPKLSVNALANSSATPGGELLYLVEVVNRGDEPTNGDAIVLEATLPPGVTASDVTIASEIPVACTAGDGSPVAGATSVKCTISGVIEPTRGPAILITTHVAPGADGVLTARFGVTGGGSAPAATARAVEVTTATPAFDIAAFDQQTFADEAQAHSTQAAAHPFAVATYMDFVAADNPNPAYGPLYAVEPVRDAFVDLPAGMVGLPTVADRCTALDLANSKQFDARPLCQPSSQVGVVNLGILGSDVPSSINAGPIPLYNMVPGAGQAAQFGFNYNGSVVTLYPRVRSNGDYGLTIGSKNIPAALPVVSTAIEFWGDPAAEEHDLYRGCPGELEPYRADAPTCDGAPEPTAFLRNSTSCAGPTTITLHADSWVHSGALDSDGWPVASDPSWKTASVQSHAGPGYPYSPLDPTTPWGGPVGNTDCDQVPFEPRVRISPTIERADSPSGLEFELTMPQQGLRDPGAIAESDLRKTVVTLPAGFSVDPSAATGLGACSAAEVGLRTPVGSSPIHFDEAPVTCPDSAKVGAATIETPLLDHPLNGDVFLAKPADNPFGSLLGLYLVFDDRRSGVVLKLAGHVEADPANGQLRTTFDENPQLPFERLRVGLFSGSRALLRTPSACGTYTARAALTGWNGKTVEAASAFAIGSGCGGGFDPHLDGGSANPLAGSASPFSLRLSRDDGTQELADLSVTLPPGLSGYLTGLPYCSDAALAAVSGELRTGAQQEASPSCPGSRIGTVKIGAGAGPTPFYTQAGRAYLAGPYKGAPLSISVVVPAVAGPFDLGSVVVRSALHVDPETAQLTVDSDRLPTILHGIPLDLRDLRVEIDRDHFILNPTSCDEMQIASTIISAQGATASPSERFQVGGCNRLRFKPSLSLRLKGETRRGGHPALTALLRLPQTGTNANVSRAVVTLPHSEFLAQSHIRTSCTRVQYAAGAGGGSECPAGSVYGRALVVSPLLDAPLDGKVYLRSNGGARKLPDLVASLDGQIHIDLVGYVDVDKRSEGLRTTFARVPDAPVSKFVLKLPAGKKSLLENSTDICRGRHRATVGFDAQNGRIRDFRPALKVKCGRRGDTRGAR